MTSQTRPARTFCALMLAVLVAAPLFAAGKAKQRAVVVLPPGSGQGDLAVLDGRSTTEHADIPKRIIRGREILRRPDLEAEMPPECAASGENSRSAF